MYNSSFRVFLEENIPLSEFIINSIIFQKEKLEILCDRKKWNL